MSVRDEIKEILEGYFNHQNNRVNGAELKSPDYDYVEATTAIIQLFETKPYRNKTKYGLRIGKCSWCGRATYENYPTHPICENLRAKVKLRPNQ